MEISDVSYYLFIKVKIEYNEWLYVFGFAIHILSFKVRKSIGKTDIYNVLGTGFCDNLKKK